MLSASDKQVLNSQSVVELGVRFDGERSLLGSSAARLLRTIWVSLYLLRGGRWSQKEAQVVLGRWVFILQFRRAAMCVLSRSWAAVETLAKTCEQERSFAGAGEVDMLGAAVADRLDGPVRRTCDVLRCLRNRWSIGSERGSHLVWKVAGDSPVRHQAETFGGAGGGAFNL